MTWRLRRRKGWATGSCWWWNKATERDLQNWKKSIKRSRRGWNSPKRRLTNWNRQRKAHRRKPIRQSDRRRIGTNGHSHSLKRAPGTRCIYSPPRLRIRRQLGAGQVPIYFFTEVGVEANGAVKENMRQTKISPRAKPNKTKRSGKGERAASVSPRLTVVR